jgi:hypothetical protein
LSDNLRGTGRISMTKKAAAAELKSTTGLRGGRKGAGTANYAAGWLAHPGKPEEELIRLGGFAWSELFVGTQSKRIYKSIKQTGEWFRFAFIQTDDAKAEVD